MAKTKNVEGDFKFTNDDDVTIIGIGVVYRRGKMRGTEMNFYNFENPINIKVGDTLDAHYRVTFEV